MATHPWYVRAILVRPESVLANLRRLGATGRVDELPNEWQLCLAVLRLWHRVLFRMDTVGTAPSGRVRPTWRARLLHHRALRLPFLLAEGAVVPLDFTGLASSPERLMHHLLGAHHDRDQFAFDLELLAAHGRLDDLARAVDEVVTGAAPRARWLRDLAVFADYHEQLAAEVRAAIARDGAPVAAAAGDPDLSFAACMRWCARQPPTPAATLRAWRAGAFAIDGPLDVAPLRSPHERP